MNHSRLWFAALLLATAPACHAVVRTGIKVSAEFFGVKVKIAVPIESVPVDAYDAGYRDADE